MTFRQVAFHDYRNVIFISLAAFLSAFAVRPDSTILPLIATLSVLLVYSPFLFRSDQPHRRRYVLLTCVALSVGSPLSRIHASLDALSTPGGSLAILFVASAILSSITLATLYVSTRFHAHSSSSWGQVTLFPAVWATVWCTVSYINPVGHLATWSVANNTDAYNWLLPLLGPTSKDWIVAAWAVVISQTIGRWYIGFQDLEDEIDLLNPQSNHGRPSDNNMTATRLLALFLVLLTVPSFVLPSLPRPVSLSSVDISTPLGVACVLPPYKRYRHHVLTLDDYIEETLKVRSFSSIALWPEGAVTFHSAAEREEAFEKVRYEIKDGKYVVGVSFEEVVGDPNDSTERQSLMRTGLALVSSKSNDTHLKYYKRHLVPFVESFRLRHSTLPPSIFELPLLRPKGLNNSDWAPASANHSRPIPVTSSICLDFAAPSTFAELDSRPALILAPARTWDVTVGYAMWLQAKQRAEELGAIVLWCDGGEGGVSGVAGNGYNDIARVGSGSFTRTIGVQHPFDARQTLFARVGDSVLIIFWLSVLGPSLLFQSIRTGRRFGRPKPPQVEPNLLDL